MLSGIDFQLFQSINSLAGQVKFLNPLMSFLAQDAEYLFYLGIIIYWFTRTEENRRMVAEALISACVALGISGALGSLFYRDRPFVTHSVIQLIKHAANASFPSDHAIGAFVIAAAIWLFRRNEGKVWLALAASIAFFSRVWCGVHYPSDVIAGGLIGFAAALAVHQLFAHWTPAGRILDLLIDTYEKLENKVWANKKISSRS